MNELAVAFSIAIPLAALIFGAVSIRNQDVRTMNENLRSEVERLEEKLKERDLHIMHLEEKYKDCEQGRVLLLERISGVELRIAQSGISPERR